MAASEVQPLNGFKLQSGVILHVRFEHSELGWQVTSHAHDRPQLTSRHDPMPVQSTLHRPGPQLRLLQLCAPLHAIVHDRLFRQLTPLRHAFVVEHRMLQSQPVGHTTA